MTVNAIKSNDNHGRISYLNSIALGGLTGYALKYALPITPQEADADFKWKLRQISSEARKSLDSFNPQIKEPEEVLKVFKELKQNGRRILIAGTKEIRPTGVFVWSGILIGATIAFINNILNVVAKNRAQAIVDREL